MASVSGVGFALTPLRAHPARRNGPFDALAELIEPTLRSMGYELVQVRMLGGARPTLQVMAEPVDRRPMTVEDCAEISHAISALLDVEDPIPGSYVLEVSSPGIDRPLVRPTDYERFAGHLAKLETGEPVAGRRRFRGTILAVAGDSVRISIEGETVEVPFAAIRRAKLVLTDELLAASRRRNDE